MIEYTDTQHENLSQQCNDTSNWSPPSIHRCSAMQVKNDQLIFKERKTTQMSIDVQLTFNSQGEMQFLPETNEQYGTMFKNDVSIVLTLLAFLGYNCTNTNTNTRSKCSHWYRQSFYLLCWIATLALNTYMAYFSISMISAIRRHLIEYGKPSQSNWLNPTVMAAILTGIKPIRNTCNILIFALYTKSHRMLLEQIEIIDDSMKVDFDNWRPNWRKSSKILIVAILLVFIIVFLLRCFEVFTLHNLTAMSPLMFASLFIAPMLSVYQLTPLFYFLFLCANIRLMFKRLYSEMISDIHLTKHDTAFYYEWYMRLTRLSYRLLRFSALYLFLSVIVSVVIVCLMIYFIINAREIVTGQVDDHGNATLGELVVNYSATFWATAQVSVAICYLIIIIFAGMGLNENARRCGYAALWLKPTDEKGRFDVLRILQRISMQSNGWGVSIWRALPVERSLLFTLIGLITSYAVILLKLQEEDRRNSICASTM